MILPDYGRSILSITSSVLAHYGAPCAYPTLPEVDAQLATNPAHVYLLILDGLGDGPLRRALKPDSYLVRHAAARVTSVFPSTTTAATTAYYTGKSPMEHGWLAWMMYMKEYAADVVTFLGNTYYTQKPIDDPAPSWHLMPYQSIFEQIHAADPTAHTNAIFPFEAQAMRGVDTKWLVNDIEQACANMRQICASQQRSFTLFYWGQPDTAMHDYGVDSPQVLEQYALLNRALEKLSGQLTDSLIVIASDHGLINATEKIDVSQIPELMETLIMPPMMEGRATAFYVKQHRKADFEQIFAARFAQDFLLLTREQVYETGIFGRGEPHRKFDDYIGDYVACATGGKIFVYSLPGDGASHEMIGYHAGLTEDEMNVCVMLDRVR